MATNKVSRTIAEQISLLKSRGMCVKDEQKAAFYLTHISYYRLKGYWWDMQSDNISHTFALNSYFEDVIDRYNFDCQLRLILFNAIEIIEIALRTKLIYHLSQAFGGLWYLDATLFEDANLHAKHIDGLKSEFARSGEIFAKDFRYKHPTENTELKTWENSLNPDAWIIFEVVTFGTLSKFYKNLKNQLPQKSLIANEFGLNSTNNLSSWLEAISFLRNIIAHHSRVWSRNIVKRITFPQNPRNQWLQYPLHPVQEKKPFIVITTMLYLCNAIDSDNEIKNKLLNLFASNPNIPIYKLGFFNHWEQEPIWK
jgi:abortive infection bacteriophage resistance protein